MFQVWIWGWSYDDKWSQVVGVGLWLRINALEQQWSSIRLSGAWWKVDVDLCGIRPTTLSLLLFSGMREWWIGPGTAQLSPGMNKNREKKMSRNRTKPRNGSKIIDDTWFQEWSLLIKLNQRNRRTGNETGYREIPADSRGSKILASRPLLLRDLLCVKIFNS